MIPQNLQEILAKLLIITYLAGHPRSQLTGMVNTERAKAGSGILYENKRLNKSALNKAKDLREQQYFSHTNPQGQTPWNLINNAGYNYTSAGENLAKNFDDNAKMVKAWMASPTHKEVLMNPEYKDVGAGVSDQYTAQHFGVRKKPTIWDYLLGKMKEDY